MAFDGTFFSQTGKVIHGKSNLTIAAEQLAKFFDGDDDDDDDIGSSSDSSNNSFANRPINDKRNEYTEANYRGVLDSDLTSLTTAQRNIFIVTLSVLFGLSLCGNVCSLFVNFRRKIRPFFRACLISLAFSDLMNTVFLTASYLSQFTADFVQIWSLGNVMCSLVPFATTCAILASSMTLVGIALDRYFAVIKAVNGFWNPSVITCIACMLCIWLAAISIACPAFTFYDIIPVYILTVEHETANATATRMEKAADNVTAFTILPTKTVSPLMMAKKTSNTFMGKVLKSSMTTMRPVMAPKMAIEMNTKMPWELETPYTFVRQKDLVNMCMSDQKDVSVYYIIVFTIIFVPCIMAFFWFNTIIARKLWERRNVGNVTKHKSRKAKNETKLITTCPPSSTEPAQTKQPKSVLTQNKTCTCKSVQMSSSTSNPSSASNALCDKLKTSACSYTTNTNTAGAKATANHSREAKHLRMFIIILLMMAIFVFLRLPAWIFLLMRLYGNYSKPRHWMFYFIFGLMNLASSVLNPFFYTFLTETLKYILKLKAKLSSLHCVRCCCSENNLSAGGCTRLLSWHQTSAIPDHKYIDQRRSLQSEVHSKDSMPTASNERDEGVDCNDEVDEENVCGVHDYNQRIYTIFPSSLVSSSIVSEN